MGQSGLPYETFVVDFAMTVDDFLVVEEELVQYFAIVKTSLNTTLVFSFYRILVLLIILDHCRVKLVTSALLVYTVIDSFNTAVCSLIQVQIWKGE